MFVITVFKIIMFTIKFTFYLGGIFLLLGYSSTDEALLRPYTNLGVQDAIRGLQHYLVRHVANQVGFSISSQLKRY